MTVSIRVGHVLTRLAEMPATSCHVVVTSPPYYGLRSYSTEPQIWGGDGSCGDGGHEWGEYAEGWNNRAEVARLRAAEDERIGGTANHRDFRRTAAFCRRCHAWRGELGQEPTLSLYLDHLMLVFDQVWRVLRDDGTCWVNIGDSYATNGMRGRNDADTIRSIDATSGRRPNALAYGDNDRGGRERVVRGAADGLKPKDLMLVPARFAIRMQEAGWYVRNDLIWAKTSCMPEAVTDRATRSHEYIFHFSKRATYFYDGDAVREPHAEPERGAIHRESDNPHDGRLDDPTKRQQVSWVPSTRSYNPNGRNQRTVWTIGPSPFPDAHFATFPPEIPRRAILAGTSERGCCAKCGAPWKRTVETRRGGPSTRHDRDAVGARLSPGVLFMGGANPTGKVPGSDTRGYPSLTTETTGWLPTCRCGAEVMPCTVLDIFAGAGTTGLVADRLGRDAVLVELSESYAKMAAERIRGDAPLFVSLEVS